MEWSTFCRKSRALQRFTTRQSVYKRAMARRPLLDDAAFYSTYYGSTEIPKDIPIRLRHLYAHQLGNPWQYLRPRDLIYRVDDDIDFAEIVFEAEEEFDVSIPMDEIQHLDGSFDGLVRCIAEKLLHRPATRS